MCSEAQTKHPFIHTELTKSLYVSILFLEQCQVDNLQPVSNTIFHEDVPEPELISRISVSMLTKAGTPFPSGYITLGAWFG